MKLFLIGRPGAGKSTAYYLLEAIARREGQAIALLSDFPILYQMFCEESGCASPRFQAVHGGFDIVDYLLWDEVLRALETHVLAHPYSEQEDALVVVEFARDDYTHALAQFSSDFLRDATVLYIDATVETCIARIDRREHCGGAYVSEEIMRGYYGKQVLPVILPVEVISNDGTEEEFEERVRQLARKYIASRIDTLAHMG